MLKPIHLASVSKLSDLASAVEASGWGCSFLQLEEYDPTDLQESIAAIQARLLPSKLSALPRLKTLIAQLNQRLHHPIPLRGEKVDISCLPVALIYWIDVIGIDRLTQS